MDTALVIQTKGPYVHSYVQEHPHQPRSLAGLVPLQRRTDVLVA